MSAWYVYKKDYYPKYDPAEGGIYMSGYTITQCIKCKTYKEALRIFNTARREFNLDEEMKYLDGTKPYKFETIKNLYHRSYPYKAFGVASNYIGDGWKVEISNKKPTGYNPVYC